MPDALPHSAAAAEQVLEFDTPENVVFGYLVAGIGSRFLAALVDTVLIVLLQIVVNLTLLFVAANVSGESLLDLEDSSNVSLLAAIFGLVAFAFLWGYYIFFELLWNGQSPGKRWVGLRVIRQDGTPIDVAAAMIRNLVRVVDFLPLYYGIGVITMFADRLSRRLGDFAAGTLVVYDRGAVTLDDLARETARLESSLRATPLSDAPLQADRAAREQHVALARTFLSRQYQLYNRRELALYLAQRLLADMGAPAQAIDEQQALALLKQIAGRPQAPGE